MGNYYYFYSPKDGKLVDDGKYAGMPFLRNEADKYGKDCAVKWNDYNKIDSWSIDKTSEFYKQYFSFPPNYECVIYYSREEIIEMQKLMTCNETLLEEILDENNLDGLDRKSVV